MYGEFLSRYQNSSYISEGVYYKSAEQQMTAETDLFTISLRFFNPESYKLFGVCNTSTVKKHLKEINRNESFQFDTVSNSSNDEYSQYKTNNLLREKESQEEVFYEKQSDFYNRSTNETSEMYISDLLLVYLHLKIQLEKYNFELPEPLDCFENIKSFLSEYPVKSICQTSGNKKVNKKYIDYESSLKGSTRSSSYCRSVSSESDILSSDSFQTCGNFTNGITDNSIKEQSVTNISFSSISQFKCSSDSSSNLDDINSLELPEISTISDVKNEFPVICLLFCSTFMSNFIKKISQYKKDHTVNLEKVNDIPENFFEKTSKTNLLYAHQLYSPDDIIEQHHYNLYHLGRIQLNDLWRNNSEILLAPMDISLFCEYPKSIDYIEENSLTQESVMELISITENIKSRREKPIPAILDFNNIIISPGYEVIPVSLVGTKWAISLHIEYLRQIFQPLPRLSFMHTMKPWLAFWTTLPLKLLQYQHSASEIDFLVHNITRCESPEGGWAGGYGQQPHMLTTYAAVMSLIMLNKSEYINKVSLNKFLYSCKKPNGSFSVTIMGEVDVRAVYCAIATASATSLLVPELYKDTADWLLSCQATSGGFGASPCEEAHAGYTYCALASLCILNSLPPKPAARALYWIRGLQYILEGGFAGRDMKLVDSCYTFWASASACLAYGILIDSWKSKIRPFDTDATQKFVQCFCQNLWIQPIPECDSDLGYEGEKIDMFYSNKKNEKFPFLRNLTVYDLYGSSDDDIEYVDKTHKNDHIPIIDNEDLKDNILDVTYFDINSKTNQKEIFQRDTLNKYENTIEINFQNDININQFGDVVFADSEPSISSLSFTIPQQNGEESECSQLNKYNVDFLDKKLKDNSVDIINGISTCVQKISRFGLSSLFNKKRNSNYVYTMSDNEQLDRQLRFPVENPLLSLDIIDDAIISGLGGIIPRPGENADMYHTCYSLSGVAVSQWACTGECRAIDDLQLPQVHLLYNIPMTIALQYSSVIGYENRGPGLKRFETEFQP